MVADPHDIRAMAAEARALYDSQIRPKLGPQENGKFLVLNLDTGDYELDADDLEASARAKRRFGSARLFALRVGHAAAYDLGASGA